MSTVRWVRRGKNLDWHKVVGAITELVTVHVGTRLMGGPDGVTTTEGAIGSVETSGYIGNHDLALDADTNIWKGTGTFHGQDFPIEVEVRSLGTVPPFQMPDGMVDVVAERQTSFDALEWLDEADKLAALSEDEKHTLSQITTVKLLEIAKAASKSHEFTPFTTAVIAILQHDTGDEKSKFPQVAYKTIRLFKEVDGVVVVGADVRLSINGVRFIKGEGHLSSCGGVETKSFQWDMPIGTLPDAERFDNPYPTDE